MNMITCSLLAVAYENYSYELHVHVSGVMWWLQMCSGSTCWNAYLLWPVAWLCCSSELCCSKCHLTHTHVVASHSCIHNHQAISTSASTPCIWLGQVSLVERLTSYCVWIFHGTFLLPAGQGLLGNYKDHYTIQKGWWSMYMCEYGCPSSSPVWLS